MSDGAIRGLERRWRESGAAADEAAWLLARRRAGRLSTRLLEVAAAVAHPAALLALEASPARYLRTEAGDRIDLTPGKLLSVGSRPSADLTFPDPRVAARHLELRLYQDGALRFLDRSRGKTAVGRQVADVIGVVRLWQVLSLGGFRLRLEGRGPAFIALPLNDTPRPVRDGAGMSLGMGDLPAPDDWCKWVLALGQGATMRVALGIADASLPGWEAFPRDSWARRLKAAAESWLDCPCAAHLEALEAASAEDPLLVAETSTGSYDRGDTLASADEWAYKQGITPGLAACYGVRAPGLAAARALPKTSLQQPLDGAARGAGRAALEAAIRRRLIPWLLHGGS